MSLSMSFDAERWFNNRFANYSKSMIRHLKSGQGYVMRIRAGA
jgi:hypothetical protein